MNYPGKKKVIRNKQYSCFLHYKRSNLFKGSTTRNPRKMKAEMYFLYFSIINLISRSVLQKSDSRKVVGFKTFSWWALGWAQHEFASQKVRLRLFRWEQKNKVHKLFSLLLVDIRFKLLKHFHSLT